MKYKWMGLLFILFYVTHCVSGTEIITQHHGGTPDNNIQVEQWNIFQLSLEGTKSGNPFVDVVLSAEFRNGDKIFNPQGFYDGNGRYIIRFMPSEAGEWQYVTKSNNKQLDGIRGSFTCFPAGGENHGPVRVRNTYHLGYADGKPYWQIGTTCYAWVHQTEDLQIQTLQTLKESPFNKLRMCVFPKSYSYNNNEPPFYPFPRSEEGINDFTRFNNEFFDHFEKRIMDLLELGIESDIILFHPYDRWGYQSMDAQTDDFYLKYVIARFAAFRNVWWSLANEYDLMESKRDYDWDRFYKIIKEHDPYDHMAGIHNCFEFYDHNRPWVSHASIQSSALERAREWREQYKKPIIYDECRYEGNIRQGWGNQSAFEMVHKFWLGTIAGCYVGHGETYQHPEDIIWWSKGGVLHGESPKRIDFLKEILEDAPLDGIEPIDTYSGGKTGEYYLYYFGTEKPLKWQFNLPEDMKFSVELIDTWNMKLTKIKGIYSGKFELDLPGTMYQALRIKKIGYYFPIGPVEISPQNGLFYKSINVKMSTTEKDADIHYTFDGSEPNLNSPLYKKPLVITENTDIKAASFNDQNEKSKITMVRFIRVRLIKPFDVENLSSGIRYHYYEGQWTMLPDFGDLSAVESGVISQFTIKNARRFDEIGFVFEGYIKITDDGVYTFYCRSDDGSKLWISDTLVVENDDIHGTREIPGQIGLSKGLYPITVHFFENEGGESLSVSYEGPKIKKQVIPADILFHKNK